MRLCPSVEWWLHGSIKQGYLTDHVPSQESPPQLHQAQWVLLPPWSNSRVTLQFSAHVVRCVNLTSSYLALDLCATTGHVRCLGGLRDLQEGSMSLRSQHVKWLSCDSLTHVRISSEFGMVQVD